jgi:quercetin dioxygenase-like cupin family protein
MIRRSVVCALVLGVAGGAMAQEAAKAPGHVVVTPDKLTWGAAPAALPRGAQAAMLIGNPAEAGPFTLRLIFPAGYKIPPHWHPTTEHVTVLWGAIQMGTGETFDVAAAHPLSVGGFSVMPAETRHYLYTKEGATVQVHGIGPFTLTYVNPADDPRKAAPPAN